MTLSPLYIIMCNKNYKNENDNCSNYYDVHTNDNTMIIEIVAIMLMIILISQMQIFAHDRNI